MCAKLVETHRSVNRKLFDLENETSEPNLPYAPVFYAS